MTSNHNDAERAADESRAGKDESLHKHRVRITYFKDEFAKTKIEERLTLPELAEKIRQTKGQRKENLPWLKLASFGDVPNPTPSPKTGKLTYSLRYDANVEAVSGVEGDYDAKKLPFEDAVAVLKRFAVRGIIYTTPSYSPENPKWRALLPFSAELPPAGRAKYMTWLNGMFGGIFASESFTLNQSYFYGRPFQVEDAEGVFHPNTSPLQVEIVDGDFIDKRIGLAADAMGYQKPKIEKSRSKKANGKKAKSEPRGFEAHLALLGDGPGLEGFNMPLLRAVASYVATYGAGLNRATLKTRLMQAIDAAPTTKPRDYLKNFDNYFEELVAGAVEKFGHGNATIRRMNETHAVLPIGGKTRVVSFGELEEFPGRRTIVQTQTFGDFKALEDKYRVEYDNDDEDRLRVGRGSYWLSSPHRLQYDGGMAFMPRRNERVVGNKLNLWTGFGVEVGKPDGQSGAAGCKLFLDFARDVICGGNEADYDYLIKREAFIIQEHKRSEIALALHSSEEGVGKGFYEKHMGHLLGKHAMQITNPKHIVGAFNPHLETLLRLTADEALFVGNHEHRNALFGLITEGKITIEPKGLGVYSATNHLNISITSNAVHFIPVSGTARRFFVPTVSPKHMQDRPYFREIENELVNEGGYQALLYHLLHEVDLRDFDVGVVPRTAGLSEQAAYGRRGLEGLVEKVCNEGQVPCAHPEWPGFTVTSGEEKGQGFHHYINMSKDREIAGRGEMVIKRLRDEWGCTTGERRRETGGGDRTRGFSWADLGDLRAKFEERFGKQEWRNADVTEWTIPEAQERSSGARISSEERISKKLKIVHWAEKAIKVSDQPEIWLPLSQIEINPLGDGRSNVDMPLWLAKSKGLVDWADAEPEPEIPFPT